MRFSYLNGSGSLLLNWVATTNEAIDLGPCECELICRFSLPCKHHVLQAAQTGQALPCTLLHPPWWLQRPPVQQLDWEHSYGQEQVSLTSIHSLLEFRDTLLIEERSRLEPRILESREALLAKAQTVAAIAELTLL
jgi:hypothetical protein